MTNDTVRVSVIVPVFNAAAFLAATIGSVFRQRHNRLEVIVVDDGSTDGSSAIATEWGERIRYVRQPNAGPPSARNRGLRLATGQFITFIDADDLWPDDRLETQLRLFASHPDVDIVAGRFQWVRAVESGDSPAHLAPIAEPRNPLSLGTGLFRRRVFETVGEMDETLWCSDDVDWYLRARELGIPMLLHDDVVLWYRRHESNITNDQERGRAFYLTAIKKSLDRRRMSNADVATPLPSWSDFTNPVPSHSVHRAP